jgi:hypothetical protein
MKALFTILLSMATLATGQSFPRDGALASTSGPPVTGAVYTYLTGSCTGTSCTGAVTVCLSSNSSSCPGTQVANTSIFYTLDGSPANEADKLYTGPFTIADPGTTRSITINAMLAQTTCTSSSCGGATGLPCTSGSPCYGVLIQDGQNVKAPLKTAVACPESGTASCPSSVFNQSTAAAMPTPIGYGGCTSSTDNGVRGSPTADSMFVAAAQPTVDLYTNSNTMMEFLQATAGVNCASSNGDTETLLPYDSAGNVSPYNASIGAEYTTNFAVSYYIAHNHQTTATNATLPNAANLSEMELDHNWWAWIVGSSSTCGGSPTAFCYATFNFRSSMAVAAPVPVGGVKYGQWQYSSQTVDWKTFPYFFPSVAAVTHDSSFPFGTIAALGTTGCPVFTPGAVNYQSETAYPLEPGFGFVDQGNGSIETIHLDGPPGGPITGCERGVGGTAHSHSAGALMSEAVKIQAHATHDVGTGASCIGATAPNAMFMDYFSANGNYYGTPAYKNLMGLGLPNPSINVLDTWGTQTIGGNARSIVCSFFGKAQIYDSPDNRFYSQWQTYSKAGTSVKAMIGIWLQHWNGTASWGPVGSPSQTTITQAP